MIWNWYRLRRGMPPILVMTHPDGSRTSADVHSWRRLIAWWRARKAEGYSITRTA